MRYKAMLSVLAAIGLPACQSAGSVAPPQPASPLTIVGCSSVGTTCPPTVDAFVRASDGNTGEGSWNGVSGQPISLASRDSTNHPIGNGTMQYSETSASASIVASAQTAVGTASTSVNIPLPFPVGTVVAVNSQVRMEQTAPSVFAAWWSRNGVAYTAHFAKNLDGSISVSIQGANGDSYATTIYPVSSGMLAPAVFTCQDAHVMAGTMAAYAGLCALVGFEPVAALATMAAGGYEIASAFLCK